MSAAATPLTPVSLKFAAAAVDRRNLSGAAMSDRHLWIVGDESTAIERFDIRTPAPGAGVVAFEHSGTFALAELIDLPEADGDAEADLEGLAVDDSCLWLVGSHSLKRGKPDGRGDDEADADALASTSMDGNRLLLARVPLEADAEGRLAPRAVTTDGRRASRLRGNASRNPLLKALSRDPHFGLFAHVPGKDNGLDIEGVAVDGERVLLGLRGPVLRGWACILELTVRQGARRLKLHPHEPPSDRPRRCDARLRKHFVDLDGLGIRDLHPDGDDLVVLAGPTMELDGEIRAYRWRGALRSLRENPAAVRFVTGLEHWATLPHGDGTDRAEALARLPARWSRRPSWLVVYDAPAASRMTKPRTLVVDLLRV